MCSFLIRLLGACITLSVAAAVLNGENVKSLKEFPYLVAVLEDGDNICGGSLLRLGLVLTAAYCVHDIPKEDLEVRAATLARVDNSVKNNKLPILEKIVHPRYNIDNQEHDLAILKLKGKFIESENIDIINLPLKGQDYNYKMGTVMGWGDLLNGKDATVLQSTKIPIIGYTNCLKFYDKTTIFQTNYCNYDVSETKTLCDGDSGGPLAIHYQTKRDTLAGVNSWVWEKDDQCSAEYPSVATNVEMYLDWINPYIVAFDKEQKK